MGDEKDTGRLPKRNRGDDDVDGAAKDDNTVVCKVDLDDILASFRTGVVTQITSSFDASLSGVINK